MTTHDPCRERLDRIAREAARLIALGMVEDIQSALHMAADSLGETRGPLPGPGRVRKHAQAMTMQELGDAGYAALQQEHWRVAEELMTAFEQALPEARALFVGRGAKGQIDAGVTLHIRLYTREPMAAITRVLAEFEYAEPTHETVSTRLGRLNRLQLNEEGIEIAITRCLPEMEADAKLDLFTGRRIETLTLEELRQKLASNERDLR